MSTLELLSSLPLIFAVMAPCSGRYLNFTLNVTTSASGDGSARESHFLDTVDAVNASINYINDQLDVLQVPYSLAFSTVLSQVEPEGDSNSDKSIISGQCCVESGLNSCGTIDILFWPSISNCSSPHHSFSLTPSPAVYAQGLLTFMKQYNWQRISVITKGASFYDHVLSEFSEGLRNTSIKIIQPQKDQVFPKDVRIFFLNMNFSESFKVLCQASLQHKYFPQYVWITYGNGENMSFEVNGLHCAQKIEDVLDGVLFITPVMISENYLTLSKHLGYQENIFLPMQPLKYLAFDAVFTLATIYNSSRQHNVRPRIQATLGCAAARDVSITGMTGPISFDSSGCRRLHLLGISQFRKQNVYGAYFGNKNRVYVNTGQSQHYQVASLNISLSTRQFTFQYVNDENSSTIFRGSMPYDGTPLKEIHHHPIPLIIVYYILATAGLVFVVVCLLFNIIFRNKRIVRLTSPNLNYFILLGAILLYVSVYLRLYPNTGWTFTEVICNVQAAFCFEGYVLCFAPIIMKMLRINYIFHNPFNSAKKPLRDCYLIMGILVLIGIISLLVALSMAVPMLRPDITLVPDNERPSYLNSDNITVNFCIYECYGANSYLPLAWTGIEFFYLILLQVIALVLAIANRKVKIDVLNDFKEMSIIVYTITVMFIPLFAITYGVSSYTTISEVFFSGAIMLATTVFLFFTFIPKMRNLYRDPKGKEIFPLQKRTTSISESTCKTVHSIVPSVSQS